MNLVPLGLYTIRKATDFARLTLTLVCGKCGHRIIDGELLLLSTTNGVSFAAVCDRCYHAGYVPMQMEERE